MQMPESPAEYDDIDGVARPAQNPLLFGHEEVRRFLTQMRKENHLHHALLFEGKQGIGKATLGFHFAWYMLSEQREDDFAHVDETCHHWRQITLGCHPGLLHISRPFDAKAGKFRNAVTIDEMRKVNHFMHQSQADNGWRIVIIDPADDMNRNSANALLKILEEPPRKALFILISHHKGRLLPTIRSRCQSWHFKPLEKDVLTHALEALAGQIGFGQNAQHDSDLAEKAQGSVRKALLLLSHGGLEIATALDDFLSEEIFDLAVANQLATVLSNREAQIQFDHFTDHLLEKIGESARQYALEENFLAAERLAGLWQSLSDEIGEALAYNLDKKHFILVLLSNIHKQLHDYNFRVFSKNQYPHS